MADASDLMKISQSWRDVYSDDLRLGDVAGKLCEVAGGVFAILSRIQALLSKASEKPYQARLLEARINSCKALLSSLGSRIDHVHLEPLRIKLSHIEQLVVQAGTRLHVHKLTDERLATDFEKASAALMEEETALALVVRALPPDTKNRCSRGRSTSGSRRAARRRSSSRSTSSTRNRGGRSQSPSFSEPIPDVVSEVHGMPQLETVVEFSPPATSAEMPLTLTVRSADPIIKPRSPADRMKACLTGKALGYSRSFHEEEAQATHWPSSELVSSVGDATVKRAPELPLPEICMVERETDSFWKDTVTLVFSCAVSGHQHRVTTKQWTGSVSERLVSWVSSQSWTGKTWEEEMDQDSLSPMAKAELKELLLKSGWYDKFRYDASCGKGSWVIREVANAGYEPCSED